MKAYLSILYLAIICHTYVNAQDISVTDYLQQAGKYAGIYNGKREIVYNPSQYENLPYYMSPDFTEASVFYEKNYFPNQKVRLDLFKEQLVVLSPEKQHGVILNPQHVEKVQMYNKTFIWLDAPEENGLEAGYYMQLTKGKRIQLFYKEKYSFVERIRDNVAVNYFNRKVRYYFSYDNRYYAVKNKNAFSKLFPQYKKQINTFVQENRLSFKQNAEEDLISLARYCEELIAANATPDAGNTIAGSVSSIKFSEDTLAGAFMYDNEFWAGLDTTLSSALTYIPPKDTLGENRMLPEIEELKEVSRAISAISENLIYPVGDSHLKTVPEKVTLQGKVIDLKTESPLPGITLILKEPYTVATTDKNGNYTVRLPSGRIQLDISGVNIKASRRQLMLYEDGTLNIVLAEEPHQLDEVTVIAQRANNVRSVQLGMEKIQVPKIKNIPTAFGETDILKVVQSLPGVKTVGEASSGYNVRGGATDQNLILFNDGTIYNPNHLFGFFSAFNSDMVKEAELYKSSIPAQYGGRISSVLDIAGKEANKEKITGSAGLGLVTSKLTLEVPVIKNKTSVLLSGRTTYSDWILNLLPEKSGYRNGSAGFYDIGTVLSHQFNEKSFLTVYGYYSHDRFRFNENQKYAYSNLNASVRWKRFFNDQLFGNFAAGYDHYDYKNTDSMNEAAAYTLSSDINQLFVKTDFTYDWNRYRQKLNFGLKSMLYNLNSGNYEPYGANSLVELDRLQNEKALESAIYLEDQWDITHKWSVTAGIRLSMFNAFGPRTYYTYNPDMLPYESTVIDTVHANSGQAFKTYIGPEFRLSTRYALVDNFSVKAGFNTMRQYIHKLSNTVIMSPTDTWKLSDVNILPQRGWQAAAGLYYNTPKRIWLASVETYYKKMSDYLDYRSGARILMNHHIETDVINTQGYAYGVEFSLKKEVGKLNGWLSYTYSRTFLRQSDELISNPVNNGNWYPTDYDKPHDFKLTGNYKFTRRYSFSVNLDYSTGRPTTIPAGKYYDATLGAEQVFYTDRNTYRIPDYFRMDLSFNIEPSHKLTLLTHSSISFGVYNVTGRKNVYSIYYVSEEGKTKGYKLSIFGAPIPFITYNIKF